MPDRLIRTALILDNRFIDSVATVLGDNRRAVARETTGKMLPMFPAKGMFNIMKARHQLWIKKYPNQGEARAFPLTGIENARPETMAAGKPRVDVSKLPFDPFEFVETLPEGNQRPV